MCGGGRSCGGVRSWRCPRRNFPEFQTKLSLGDSGAAKLCAIGHAGSGVSFGEEFAAWRERTYRCPPQISCWCADGG